VLGNEEKYIILENIYQSISSIIYRAFDTESNKTVIIKALNKDLYDILSLTELKSEYRLMEKIQSNYVIKAYDLINVGNRFSLVIEDFGGISLSQYIKTKHLSIPEFLDIALKISRGLNHIHENQIIHNDVNPSNIIYNPDNKFIKLIDFGIASEYSFETMQAINPNSLEGTLPYISPEQTGRMNIPVDYRTDFYSLGVTLYELACNKLPLFSADPAEMIYSHIAMNPVPACELDTNIPKTISAIISKLMAKRPEERYQNAAGIIFDIERCIEKITNNGMISEFELAAGDIGNRFEIPKKIYGREHEIQHLLSTFAKAKTKAQFILLAGYSGIGKTFLVNELHKPIIKADGTFISGKYEQFARNTPFSAVLQAIDQFCNYILAESEMEIEFWKNRILHALGANARLITKAVPRLKLIIGEQAPLQELSPLEEQIRFRIALEKWLSAVSAPEHPVVFFMDDLQWADISSLNLFEEISIDPNIKGLMFIGTYRKNEVDASHPLIRSIEKAKKRHAKIEIMDLGNLDVNAVGQMIADSVKQAESEVTGLARVVHEKTLGSPFYTIELLKYCYQKKLIYYNQTETRWNWNESEISITENVADYLIGRIKKMPLCTQELICIAACIGNNFDIKVLAEVTGKDLNMVAEELKAAITEEMIYASKRENGSLDEMRFKFCHDKFQQAGYQSLAEDIKKRIHLNIARYYEAFADWDQADNLFVLADHYSKALDCLITPEEMARVIEIFLGASHAASRASAFNTCRQYLELIMNMASETLKNNDAFLLKVYIEYHMVLYSLAEYEELDKIYNDIEKRITNPADLARSCCLQLISLANRGRFEEACWLGIKLLEKLGVKFPEERLTEEILIEIEKYYKYEQNGKLASLEQLETLHDPQDQAIARILGRILTAGVFHDPLISLWAIILNTNLMIEKGISSDALVMSASLNMVFSILKNDYRTGYLMAKRAMQIANKKGFIDELSTMYGHFSLLVCHWFENVEMDIYYAHEAYKGNLQKGDLEYAGYTFHTSQIAILESCENISEMQTEGEAALSFANRTGNLHSLAAYVSFSQLVKAVQGETFSFGSFDDEVFNEEKHIEDTAHDAQSLCLYYIYRALSAVLFSDFKTALLLTEKAAVFHSSIAGFYSIALSNFLHSLAICKTIDDIKDSAEKESLQKTLINNQQWMYERAQDAPGNFMHLYDLIDAEMNAMAGKHVESLRLYEKSIIGSKDNKRPYHYALACELAGQRYLQLEISKTAAFYLREAYSAFLVWGAAGKTEAMKEKYPQHLFSSMDSVKSAQLTTNTCSLTDIIDLNAIIKATQTISGEIERNKLLEKIMKIIIENSGSNNGYILLGDENGWILSGYEMLNGVVEIMFNDQAITFENTGARPILPFSMISYVMRTKEPVIIGNIMDSQFVSDNYFCTNTTASVMCFPILSQNILKGIVYLENHIFTEAFSPERLEVLNIFASQAAISLENSILYSELEIKVKERTSQLEEALNELAMQHEKLKSAQNQLVQSEKMAGLGVMVAGVAHEINNPTNYIYLSSKTLEKDLLKYREEVLEIMSGNDDEIIHYFENNFVRFQLSLKNILDGSNRIKVIVEDLRTFSRLDESEKKLVNLATVLEATVRLVKTQYHGQIEFTSVFKTEGSIECYPSQLSQVFLNILVNSCQSIFERQKQSEDESRGRVTISLEDNGKELAAVFADNGCGMTEEVKQKIFEPFFTTKPIGKGTGLGMSISYSIIEKHTGRIEVESQPGQGTIISIFLPYGISG
jgi:predicted ATPase/nitrogen-specific signal transduction histidine kinase/tRNA A-37 threonylcarbamoyl transferase component Bud32